MFYVVDNDFVVRASSPQEAMELVRNDIGGRRFKVQEIKSDGPALLIDIMGWEEPPSGVLETFESEQVPVFIDFKN